MFHVEQRMDYHIHTVHSFDGRQTVDEVCRKMTELGVHEFCLTEHIETGHPDASVDVPPIWDVWLQEMEWARKSYPFLKIRAGVEIGDNPCCRERIADILRDVPFDFHLLSLHLVHGVDCYDQKKYYGGKTRAQAYREYVEAKAESICAWTDFDSAAHIGYVSRYSPYVGAEKLLRYEDAPDAFDAIFKHLIQHDKCLEVNTSGIRETGDFLPQRELIRRYIDLGGEQFTFGSDAHDAQRDYAQIEDAKELVRSLGGGYQAGFSHREKTLYRL